MRRFAVLGLAGALAVSLPAAAQTPEGDDTIPVALADLPFAVDLPEGFETRLAPRAEFDEYQVVRDGEAWMGVHVGARSRFPYYDGRRVDFGGASAITMSLDGAQRRVETLQIVEGEGWQSQIHVWLLQPVRQDWALAGEIADSIRPLDYPPEE